ncbi:MAG: rRNA maturation RNase YbeY [Myxococcales bacterium]|nr:rRNA maturation RNase YbeY [Myxococcales bacterium]MCB9709434.1 rRNA maturation RNase YbeY [Myxococcales bacterium]
MLRALSIEAPELSILLCDDGSMRTLNRDYRKQDKPTDVLAFPMGARPRSNASVLLGDVVISLPTARRQAAGRGHDAMEEVTFLLAHGLLHLLGMDHRDPEEEESMMRYACALWATSRRTLGHVDKSKAGY